MPPMAQTNIFSFGEPNLPRDDAIRFGREHFQTLGVVRTRGHDDLDPLFLIQLELVVEDLLVEGILEALVGEVDQQLLELVFLVEILEA